MDNRKRSAGSSHSGNVVYWSSSFLRQPARALIVEAVPPWWSETSKVLCDALDNFLSLACSLDGPCRIPLLSLFAVSRQQECLLPFGVRQMTMKYFWESLLMSLLTPISFVAYCYCLSLLLLFCVSISSKFAVTLQGCVPVLRNWGQFLGKAISEELPEEASC